MAGEHGRHAALLAELLRPRRVELGIDRAQLQHLDPGLRRQHFLGEALGGELVQRPLGVLYREGHESELAIGPQVEPRRHEDFIPPAARREEDEKEGSGRAADGHGRVPCEGRSTVG